MGSIHWLNPQSEIRIPNSFMPTHQLHTAHERSFDDYRYVYPVLSRRSGGMSIGVNLNPDKVCNFDCIYCQVDRREQSETTFVGMERLLEELRELLPRVATGKIFATEKFRDYAQPLATTQRHCILWRWRADDLQEF